MNVRFAVRTARFQQEYRIAFVFTQPIGQGSAGGTSTDDDIVSYNHFLAHFAQIDAEPPRQFDALMSIVYNLQIVLALARQQF